MGLYKAFNHHESFNYSTARLKSICTWLEIPTLEDAKTFDWDSVINKRFWFFGSVQPFILTPKRVERLKEELNN